MSKLLLQISKYPERNLDRNTDTLYFLQGNCHKCTHTHTHTHTTHTHTTNTHTHTVVRILLYTSVAQGNKNVFPTNVTGNIPKR